ncbi:hypothetical protein O181_043202 [Austropuccinia psidii MF-1]|uniref:DNA repair protein RAD5 n=1 Tax=Austropuccinia psidii MF-1 TaxID=1389203 RepID=A0A9Q3HGK7_9BASI|nr:hypothetical protein [Austropuccinia psidii MF-1]
MSGSSPQPISLSPDPVFEEIQSHETLTDENERLQKLAAKDIPTLGSGSMSPSKRPRFFRSPTPTQITKSPSNDLKDSVSNETHRPSLDSPQEGSILQSPSTRSKRRRVLSPLPFDQPESILNTTVEEEKIPSLEPIRTLQKESISSIVSPSIKTSQGLLPQDPSCHSRPLFLNELDEDDKAQKLSQNTLDRKTSQATCHTEPSFSSLLDLAGYFNTSSVKLAQKETTPPLLKSPSTRHKNNFSPTWKSKYLGSFMCEGYMTYSSAKLSEGEFVWLSRDINPKKGRKEDRVIRLESKKNGAFARLNQKFAKWVVRLLDQKLFHFDGTLMFPPSMPRVGDSVHFYLKAYICRSAFVSLSEKVFGPITVTSSNQAKTPNFFNKLDDKEDKDRLDRQQAINQLFATIGLLPSLAHPHSAGQTTQPRPNDKQDAKLKTKDLSSKNGTSQVVTIVDSDTEDSIGQENIDLVYQKAAAHDMRLELQSPCEGFELALRPYQRQGLSWLMKMEGKHEDARENVSIHPLWEEYLFPQVDDKLDSSTDTTIHFYYTPYMGQFSLEFPRASLKCQGGILADEMGLGKTIQMAALICTARPPQSPLNRPSPVDSRDSRLTAPKLERANDEDASNQGDEDVKPFNLTLYQSKLDCGSNLARRSHATLVICPLTLLDQWKDELERCHKCLRVCLYHSDSKTERNKLSDEFDVVISTYGIVANEWSVVESKPFDRPSRTRGLFGIDWYRIILDEGHNIKNRNTRAARACYNLQGSRRWVLSGTPIVNRLEDLSSLLHFIRLEPWGNFSFYRSFVTLPFSKKDSKALTVVQIILESILLRREKKMKDFEGNAIVSLPPKQVSIDYLELNQKEQMIYDMVYRNAKSEFMEYLGKGTVLKNVTAILAILMRLRQTVLHPKLVLEKIKLKSLKKVEGSQDDVDLLRQMMKTYAGDSTEESFAATQMRALEKEIMGENKMDNAEELECILCLDVMDSRVYLPCMHAFCRNCIMSYIERKVGQTIACPSCEAPFQEASIVELVMNRSKKFQASSAPGSPVPSEPHDEKPPFTDPPSKNASVMDSLEQGNKIQKSNTLSRVEKTDISNRGYLKRNDFISSTKLEALIKHLTEVRDIEPGFSAVVFSQFTAFLDLIEQVLQRDQFRFVRLDGSLLPKQRKRALAEFNEPNRPCILVCSLKVAGVGLNLIKANRVYLMDTWWNEAIEDQAIDRVHRFGQDKPTFVVRFIVRKSIEERMLTLQKKKRALINNALGGGLSDSKAKARTLEDLETIFTD